MLFDSTLRKDLSRTFGATLVVILTIVLTMMLIRTLGQAAVGSVAPQDVILLMGYTTLGHLSTMLALSLFISVVSTLGRMYRESEMTIWFASGVRLSRFVRPVLRSSWPVLVLVVVLSLFVWPWVNQRSAELRAQFERRSDLSRVAPGKFQTSADGGRTFFIERDAQDGRIGRNVFILSNTARAESVTTARSGTIEFEGEDRFLVLESGQRNEQNHLTGSHTLARFGQYQVLAGERALSSVDQLPNKARSTRELLRTPAGPEQGELAWRLGMALGAINLMLLGIGLAATNPRRASNWNMLFALLTFIVYFNLISLSQAWVSAERMGLGTALIAIHGGAFLLSAALLVWRDHGSQWPRWGRGRRPAAAPGGAAA